MLKEQKNLFEMKKSGNQVKTYRDDMCRLFAANVANFRLHCLQFKLLELSSPNGRQSEIKAKKIISMRVSSNKTRHQAESSA